MPAGRTTRRLRWALVLIGAVAVVLVAFTGWQALKARDALTAVADDFTLLGDQLTSGDRAGAEVTLERAQENAATAHANTRGPGWWLTSKIPAVGPNVRAVRLVADVVDELAVDVLPGVVEATATLRPENLRPEDGRIDLAPIEEVAPEVVAADRELRAQARRVLRLRLGNLAPQIAEPVALMQAELARAADLSDRASRAVRLLPPMLGADGPRSYLLLFQNNAEPRTTGGIPGSFAVVHARDGEISIGKQGDAATIGRFDSPVVALSEDERTLFGEGLGLYAQDVNFTPDFPRSAEIVRTMWNQRHGLEVDGVASTDPVALSYLLEGTGAIEVAGGRSLTAQNAVDLLLSDVYREIPDPSDQNAFFASVAKQVFETVASGRGEPGAVLDGLVRGAGEHRLLLWSSVPDEQRLIAPTALSGELLTEPRSRPRVGVFLNDGTGNKLGYYLDYAVSLAPSRCQGERQVLDLEVNLRSRVPEGGRGLPDYVAESVAGAARGTLRLNVLVYAPPGGYLESVQLGGEELDLPDLEHDGRRLLQVTVELAPGEESRLTAVAFGGSGQLGEPEVRVTPGVTGPRLRVEQAADC